MSYRKLFLLIAFAPLGLLLFVGDAQPCWWCDPPDGGYNPWGGWTGGGSFVTCQIGFGDAVSSSVVNGTATIKSVTGKTFPCTVTDDNGVTTSGEGTIGGPDGIKITGVQLGQCSITDKSKKTSEREAFANCGQSGADVDGQIQIVSPSGTATWNIGGVDALTNTGACNNSHLFGATATFEKNEIFTAKVTYNNATCAGSGNDAKTNFRSCTGPLGQPAKCVDNDTDHTMGASFDQIIRLDGDCRDAQNKTSCDSDPGGVIQFKIDVANQPAIDLTSARCGDPDNPFKAPAIDAKTNNGVLTVTCPRCFASVFVPSLDGTLVATANAGDGSLKHLIGAICQATPTSGK
jgi:hypothetical protein